MMRPSVYMPQFSSAFRTIIQFSMAFDQFDAGAVHDHRHGDDDEYKTDDIRTFEPKNNVWVPRSSAMKPFVIPLKPDTIS